MSPLGKELRFCSIGEFSGLDTKPKPQVEAMVRQVAKEFLTNRPDVANLVDDSPVLCGLRPFVNDNALIFGQVEGNLFVNVGPGFNGWKIGYGVGSMLAQMIEEGGKHPYPTLAPENRVKKTPWFSKFVTWINKY
jgi:glycine/D-amino acid oxidase-like deaminating enzyme